MSGSFFRKILYNSLYLAILSIQVTVAQNIPNSAIVRKSATPVATPAAYTESWTNYIRVWEPNMPSATATTITDPARTMSQVKQTTQYYDGLGRLLQTVVKNNGISNNDQVAPKRYDENGREKYLYVPYAPLSGNVSDGKFKTSPFSAQAAFFQNATQNPGVAGESIFYTQTDYEASPLNRVSATYAAGNSWAQTGGNHPVRKQYLNNTIADSVTKWVTTSTTVPAASGKYAAGDLSKEVTINERGLQTIIYTDKENKTVLKKIQIGGTPGTAHMGWLCTYYVYDNNENLVFVIPPLAVEKITSSWDLSTVTTDLCFIYRYDQRNRMIVKKLPGADSTEMVYDRWDRMVYSRDGNLRNAGSWQLSVFDLLNRPVQTGLYAYNVTRTALQTEVNNTTTKPNTFPVPDPAKLTPLTYTFYDNYSFSGVQAAVTADLNYTRDSINPYAERITATSTMTRGLITGTSVRIIGTSKWITSTNYFDNKGRIIQIVSDNEAGGKDVISNLYDFSGKLLSSYIRHTNPRSVVTPQSTLLTMLLYDATGRLAAVKKTLNGIAATEKVIATYTYDNLGQQKTLQLGNAPVERLTYEYTIRGWLKSINKDYLNTGSGSQNHFGLELHYDEGFKDTLFNGNLTGIRWRGWSDKIARAYGYNYDYEDRLINATFRQQNSTGAAWTNDQVDLSVPGIVYDANGNIKSMAHNGMDGTTKVPLDKLAYTYKANSNILQSVFDSSTVTTALGDFKNGTNSGNDYDYDLSGNMTKDLNKGIASITYNHLNLPQLITITGKGTIAYTYDATGNRLKKVVTDNTVTPSKVTTTDYIGSFVYKNDSLSMVSHEQGRIRSIYKTGSPVSFTYDYFVKDHLGNVREVLSEQSDFTMYAATMEPVVAPLETALFSNIDESRIEKPAGYPANNNTGNYVAKLNAKAGGKKIGPSIVLRVMAGDTVQFSANAFYKSQSPEENQKNKIADNILADLAQTFIGSNSAGKTHGNAGLPVSPFNAITQNDYQQLKEKDPGENKTGKPKAYLNYVLFDDQFKLVDANSGVKQVKGEPDQLQTLSQDKMAIQKSGFLYVYTSNETEQDVYFDNIILGVVPGPVLEETHYYPFGLSIAGISNNSYPSINYAENRKKFQQQDFDTELNLNWYQFKWRTHDPQIGRFIQTDPLATKYESNSPYAFSENHVTTHIEIEGLEKFTVQNGVGQSTTIYGPFANSQQAQRYYDTYYTTRGQNLTVGDDGYVVGPRVTKLPVKEINVGKLSNVNGIVLHRTASPSTSSTLNGFRNKRNGVYYGTQFLVGDDGGILQTASLSTKTNQVLPYKKYSYLSNSHIVGIEVVGNFNKETKQWDPLTEKQITSVAWLSNSLLINYCFSNDKLYDHDIIGDKTAGEGTIVHMAIEQYLNNDVELPKLKEENLNSLYFWLIRYTQPKE